MADPAFASLSSADQLAVASLLYSGHAGQSQHKSEIDGVFPVFWRDKQKAFGSAANFEEINFALDYFRLNQPAHIGWGCQGYTLSDKAQELVGSYLALSLSRACAFPDSELGLENAEGKPFPIPVLAIRPYSTTGSHTRFRQERIALKAATEIDGEALREFIESAHAWLRGQELPRNFEWLRATYEDIVNDDGPQGGRQAAEARAYRGVAQATMILDLSQRTRFTRTGGRYVFPSVYVESSTGRLYAEGDLSLQGSIREVRRAAFRGAFDVDIDCCHVALIASLCDQLNFPTPLMDEYASDKAAFRHKLAAESGISVRQVKKLLAALSYGAILSISPGGDRGAIETLLGVPAMKRIQANQTVRAFGKEVRAANKVILHDFRFNRNKRKGSNCIVNDAQRLLRIEGESADTQLSHIMQGAEANILRASMQMVSNIVLLAHDGFIAKDEVDLPSLQEHVAQITGHCVTFTQFQL